jgi:hypothetical protein
MKNSFITATMLYCCLVSSRLFVCIATWMYCGRHIYESGIIHGPIERIFACIVRRYFNGIEVHRVYSQCNNQIFLRLERQWSWNYPFKRNCILEGTHLATFIAALVLCLQFHHSMINRLWSTVLCGSRSDTGGHSLKIKAVFIVCEICLAIFCFLSHCNSWGIEWQRLPRTQ